MGSIESVIEYDAGPIVEKALQKAIGVTIKELNEDITAKLKKNPLLEFNINTNISLKIAKKAFRKGYIEKVLKSHFGDVSAAARILDVDRKTIHRMIAELKIDINECRKTFVTEEYIKEEVVSHALQDIFKSYREILHPSKINEAYENTSKISEDIVKEIKFTFITLKDAEKEFEREYISAALKENNNSLPKTAKKIGLSHEALFRKAKTLRII